eukprot:gene11969-12112_t
MHALTFTPLYGVQSNEPQCYLLRLGNDLTVLLDCGWDEQFDTGLLDPLLRVVPQIDLVLLSHPDTWHLGALPYLVGKAGLQAPVYATAAVAKLGPMFMYDHHTSLHAVSDFTVFGPEDIDAAFEKINTVKHYQQLHLVVKGVAISIEGRPAGHMVGGTVWVMESGGEVAVYGVDTNHMKERHLNGGQLPSVPTRPLLLVVDAARAHAKPVSRSAREKQLEEHMLAVLRDDGNVLLPVDSAGRMLEVMLVLDRMWSNWSRQKESKPYTLALLSPVASSTLHAARGLLEWMSDELQKDFNSTSVNPLICKPVMLCHSVGDVMRLPAGPKVVLATGASLDTGMARQLLLQWGTHPKNSIVLTQQPRGVLKLTLQVGKRVRLEGVELEAFEAARVAAEAEASAAAAGLDAAATLRESSGSISQLKRSATGAIEQVLGESGAFDVFGDATIKADEGVLMDGFAPPASAMYSMFPDEQELLQQDWDAYGAVVDTSKLRQTVEALDLEPAAEDEELEEADAPTKVVVEVVQLEVAAKVLFIEGFSGCSDGRSLRTIVASLAPRHLILVGASAQGTADMALACGKELPQQQTKVHTPGKGQTVSLRLAAQFPLQITVTTGEQQEAVDAACGDHGGIFIGNVKLSEVKQALANVGTPSEFRGGGRLVVGGSLVVRRDGPEGQLLMEGPLCEDYFKVRDVVYKLYNVC